MAYTNTNLSSAHAYERTLFATILSSSCAPLAGANMESYSLFNNPARMTQSDVEREENTAFSVCIPLLYSF